METMDFLLAYQLLCILLFRGMLEPYLVLSD